jgi:GTPase SAR1 family protein
MGIIEMESNSTLVGNAQEQKLSKKLVIVGDGGCGKTALLMVHSGLEFPDVSLNYKIILNSRNNRIIRIMTYINPVRNNNNNRL